jgi:hypothetical protein
VAKKERKVAEAKAAYALGRPIEPISNGVGDETWQWFLANESRLENEFAGQWIAVADCRVVGSGVRLTTAMRRARTNGYDHPLVHGFRPRHLQDKAIIGCWL